MDITTKELTLVAIAVLVVSIMVNTLTIYGLLP